MRPLIHSFVKTAIISLWGFSQMAFAETQMPSETAGADKESALFGFSIEELMSIEVTSASKKPQKLNDIAAAIYVITQDDIRRSGSTNIPEALRLAPGVQVAHIDSNKWAITVRGFNGRFANKLLVLMDGRTIYTPSFSGVYWDTQDTLMSDIDRIEVIRGPGGTIWGANAVNGVINIITKSASETNRGLVRASAGSHQTSVSSRLSLSAGTNADFKIFAKYKSIDGNQDIYGIDTNDDWSAGRIGARLDWQASEVSDVSFIAEAYDGESGETVQIPTNVPPFLMRMDNEVDVSGAFLISRWDRKTSENGQSRVQVYIDYSDREGFLFSEERTTFDFEGQQRLLLFDRHDTVLGVSYRSNQLDFVSTPYFSVANNSQSNGILSFFFQDEILIKPDKFYLTFGTRIEHNDLSPKEVEWMPSVRGLWKVNARNTVWAGVTRSVRTPSIFELEGELNTTLTNTLMDSGLPPVPYPVLTRLSGNPDQTSEELIAYELGYRVQPTDNFSVDIALYHNDYENLRSLNQGIPTCEPSGAVIPACLLDPSLVPPTESILLPAQFDNQIEAKGNGVEIAIEWEVLEQWRLNAHYNYLDLKLTETGTPEERSAEDPRHQGLIRSIVALGPDIDFDTSLGYVDDLDHFDIDSYWRLDARLAWRPLSNLEVALVGKNILDSTHVEFASESEDVPVTAIERAYFAELSWSF